MKSIVQCIALFIVCLFSASAVHAQSGAIRLASSSRDYPTRPIRMIVPGAVGGAADFVARILQPKLSDALGQQVVVDNRTGADGNIGVEISARAAPDGYTILFGHVQWMAINPSVYPKFPYKPIRDFIGISLVNDLPGAMAAHPSVRCSPIRRRGLAVPLAPK